MRVQNKILLEKPYTGELLPSGSFSCLHPGLRPLSGGQASFPCAISANKKVKFPQLFICHNLNTLCFLQHSYHLNPLPITIQSPQLYIQTFFLRLKPQRGWNVPHYTTAFLFSSGHFKYSILLPNSSFLVVKLPIKWISQCVQQTKRYKKCNTSYISLWPQTSLINICSNKSVSIMF